jgi:predicted O-linked N-acetylglucosamine transferase (SPINDLY family)
MPETFDGWMRILRRAEDSVLFLYAGSAAAERNLRKEARSRGCDETRLVFGGRLPRSRYLARYRAADLFLDTLPYNAGETASDALWAGVPVLTCRGETFAGRVAASLLRAIEMPELVATTQAQYEDMAVEIANDPKRLADIKAKLAHNRLSTRLFDTPTFTRTIESGYALIHARHRAGLAPEHTRVEPLEGARQAGR